MNLSQQSNNLDLAGHQNIAIVQRGWHVDPTVAKARTLWTPVLDSI